MAEDRMDLERDEEGVEIPVEFEEEKTQEEPASQENQEVSEEPPKEETSAQEEEETAEEEAREGAEEAEKAGEPAQEEAPSSEAEKEKPQETEGATGQEAKKGFFGRLKKDKEKEKLEGQVADLTDRLKRSMAEFDNFRKRTEKEKASMYIVGARDIVEKILPVVDSFERGLQNAPEGEAFADGMRMIYRQLLTALEETGVKPIPAVGEAFDPNLHNAVMHVEDESVGENIIVEEFQKGYTYKDFVVRHSMVKVAN